MGAEVYSLDQGTIPETVRDVLPDWRPRPHNANRYGPLEKEERRIHNSLGQIDPNVIFSKDCLHMKKEWVISPTINTFISFLDIYFHVSPKGNFLCYNFFNEDALFTRIRYVPSQKLWRQLTWILLELTGRHTCWRQLYGGRCIFETFSDRFLITAWVFF